MPYRRSTVYDAAALRLHPSGVRVPSSVEPLSASSSKVKNRPTNAKKESRGHWIATDAAGDGRVKKRRKVVQVEPDESSHDPLEEDAEEVPRVYKDARSNRRAAFAKDLTFLEIQELSNDSAPHLRVSSDFLKCLHHFASNYYGERGQLFDSAKQYRKEKSRKRRLREMQSGGGSNSGSGQDEEDEEAQGQNANQEPSDRDEPSQSNSMGKTPAERVRKPRLKEDKKDMYKAFTGSALLCIGMLVQTHIALSLKDEPPPSWEDELENYDGPMTQTGDFTMPVTPRKRSKIDMTQKAENVIKSPRKSGDGQDFEHISEPGSSCESQDTDV